MPLLQAGWVIIYHNNSVKLVESFPVITDGGERRRYRIVEIIKIASFLKMGGGG